MTNSVLTPDIIAKEALKRLKNNLVMAKRVHRGYKNEFKKVGDDITIPRPIRYEVTDGATLNKQDVVEGDVTLAVDKRKHVAFGFTSQDLTMDPVSFGEKFVEPAVSQLAHQVDMDLLALYDEVPDWVGDPGQNINSFADFAKGPERLDHRGVPQSDRTAVLSVADAWALVGSQTELNSADNIVQDAYRSARIGNVAGIEVLKSQQVRAHAVGDHAGSPVIDGDNQDVTYASAKSGMTQTLTTDGWTGSKVLKEGDVFTIDGVYDVNPNTKDALPHLKQFVIRETITTAASGSNDTNLTIYPAIITSGPYQNVSAAPQDGESLNYMGTALGSYNQNLVFHKNAFALVTVPLIIDQSMSFAARATDKDTGLSVRIVRAYDVNIDDITTRLDIHYGCKAIYPELATRLSGSS